MPHELMAKAVGPVRRLAGVESDYGKQLGRVASRTFSVGHTDRPAAANLGLRTVRLMEGPRQRTETALSCVRAKTPEADSAKHQWKGGEARGPKFMNYAFSVTAIGSLLCIKPSPCRWA